MLNIYNKKCKFTVIFFLPCACMLKRNIICWLFQQKENYTRIFLLLKGVCKAIVEIYALMTPKGGGVGSRVHLEKLQEQKFYVLVYHHASHMCVCAQ